MSQRYVTFKLLPSALVTAFGIAVTSCGDGVTEVKSIKDLAGTWVATRVEFTVIADPQQQADLIQLGGSTVLIIETNGEFHWETKFPGDDVPGIDQGTVSVSGSNLVFAFDPLTGEGGTFTFAFTLSDNVLTLTGNVLLEDGDFGFTGEQFEIPTEMEVELHRG